MEVRRIHACRSCHSADLQSLLDFGSPYLSDFPESREAGVGNLEFVSTPVAPEFIGPKCHRIFPNTHFVLLLISTIEDGENLLDLSNLRL